MKRVIKRFNDFNKTNESFYSRENEESLSNDNIFNEDEESITDDNDMIDKNDDHIDDEIQYSSGDIETFSNFNPNVSMLPKEWSIIKHMTDHGVRLGMCYTTDIDDGCEEIESNLDYNTACDSLTQHSNNLNIQQFNNSIENYLGGLHKSIIKKPNISTSYTK